MPSVNRPPHAICVVKACWAMIIGWRVWIGTTAVPISMRSVACPMSVTAVIASR